MPVILAPSRSWGRGFSPLLALALFACQTSTVLPEGRFAGPSAVTVSTTTAGVERLFIANADGAEIRVYEPKTRLFVRGPNAVSPLSILPGFRPTKLAAGASLGPGGTSQPFVLVGGAARRVATIDTTSLELVEGAAEKARCEATSPMEAAGCLRGPVLDVAATNGRAVAVLGAETSTAGLAVFSAAIEEGAAVLELSRVIELPGSPVGVALSSDGFTAWVSDRSAARLLVVSLSSGVVSEFALPSSSHDVFPIPAYTDASGTLHAADKDALVLLESGRLLPVSLADRTVVKDPFDAAQSAAPLWFGTPANDVTFVPCPANVDGTPCRTTMRASAALTFDAPLLGFVALADGNVAAIEPDSTATMLFRPVDLSATGPAVSGATTKDEQGVVVSVPTVTVAADSLTPGVTPSEGWTLAFEPILHGFEARPVAIEAAGEGLSLVDGGGARERLRAGDTVKLTATTGCVALTAGIEGTVTEWAETTILVTPAVAVDPACLPVSGVLQVRATGASAWVLSGSATGFAARPVAGEVTEVRGSRSYYPAAPVSGPAFRFTLGAGAVNRGATITFSTASGLEPFTVCQVAGSLGTYSSSCLNDAVGFASGVTATSTRLYATLLAAPYLLEVVLAEYGLTDSFRVYR